MSDKPMTEEVALNMRYFIKHQWNERANALDLKPKTKKRQDAFMHYLTGLRTGLLMEKLSVFETVGKYDEELMNMISTWEYGTHVDYLIFICAVRGEEALDQEDRDD